MSLCPQVFGMYVVKLAVALVLAGGVQRVDPAGTKVRGMCCCRLLLQTSSMNNSGYDMQLKMNNQH